jgi:hypothetical protein
LSNVNHVLSENIRPLVALQQYTVKIQFSCLRLEFNQIQLFHL